MESPNKPAMSEKKESVSKTKKQEKNLKTENLQEGKNPLLMTKDQETPTTQHSAEEEQEEGELDEPDSAEEDEEEEYEDIDYEELSETEDHDDYEDEEISIDEEADTDEEIPDPPSPPRTMTMKKGPAKKKVKVSIPSLPKSKRKWIPAKGQSQNSKKQKFSNKKVTMHTIMHEDVEEETFKINYNLLGAIKNKIDYQAKEQCFANDLKENQPIKIGFADLAEGAPNECKAGIRDLEPFERRRLTKGYFWIGTKRPQYIARLGKERLVSSYMVFPAPVALPFFANPDLPKTIRKHAMELLKDWRSSNSSAKCKRSNHSRDIIIFSDQCPDTKEVTAIIMTLSLYNWSTGEEALKGKLPMMGDVQILFKVATNAADVLEYSNKKNRILIKNLGVEVCRRKRGYSGNMLGFLKTIQTKLFKESVLEAHNILGIPLINYAEKQTGKN